MKSRAALTSRTTAPTADDPAEGAHLSTMRNPLFSLIFIATCLCFASCGEDPQPAVQPAYCVDDGDCLLGSTCEEGLCRRGPVSLDEPEPPRGTPPEQCPSAELDEVSELCLPAPPQLTPREGCPGSMSEEGVCLPMVEHLEGLDAFPQECPAGTMALAGELDCVPIGTDCPQEGEAWHDEATLRERAGVGYTGRILYASASADPEAEADGTRALPFATIAQALASAASGDILALGPGEYAEAVALSRRVALVGACPTATTLVAPQPDQRLPTVHITSQQGALLSDLRITGDRPGIETARVDDAVVQSVWIDGVLGIGVVSLGTRSLRVAHTLISDTRPLANFQYGHGIDAAQGSTVQIERSTFIRNRDTGILADGQGTALTLHDVIAADTMGHAGNGNGGYGLLVQLGATASVERAILTRNRHTAILTAGAGATLTMSDSLVSDTQPTERLQEAGLGLLAAEGASIQLTRSVFSRNRGSGLSVLHAGTHLSMTDVLIADTQPQQNDMDAGSGLKLEEGTSATAERVAFVRNHEVGVGVLGAGTEMTMRDVVISDTAATLPNPRSGTGLFAEGGARVQVERAALTRNRSIGVYFGDKGTEATLSDVHITDTQPIDDLTEGRGLSVQFGAKAELERGVLLRNHNIAITVGVEEAELVLRDVVVSDTRPAQQDMSAGVGLAVVEGGNVTVERGMFSHNHHTGLHVQDPGTTLTMSDVFVTDTQPDVSTNNLGRGLQVQNGGSVQAERAFFSGNHEIGIVSLGEGTEVSMKDLTVSRTHVVGPPDATRGGVGVAAVLGSRTSLERFALLDNELAGLQLVLVDQVEVLDGTIEDNFIGLNIQKDTPAPVLVRVAIRDNCCGTDCRDQVCNVQSEDIPIPQALDAIEALEPQ